MPAAATVAIVQAAPIPLALGEGLGLLLGHVEAAAAAGARLVAFGETFLGGYPLWFDHAPAAAAWGQRGTMALHRILLEQAVVRDDPRLAPLQALVDRRGIAVSVGAHKRVRRSLQNSQILFRPHLPPQFHRKLVPTHGERLVWGRGDGSTLLTHDTAVGRVGQLICWEHWMPLARAAMHAAGESVHVAAWPTVNDTHLIASRHYAFEGGCFVLAAGTVQARDDLLDGLERAGGDPDARALLESIPPGPLQHGGSAICGPDGAVIAQAGTGPELLVATLEMDRIGERLALMDSDGHYARPDIFRLAVDRRRAEPVETFGHGGDAEPA